MSNYSDEHEVVFLVHSKSAQTVSRCLFQWFVQCLIECSKSQGPFIVSPFPSCRGPLWYAWCRNRNLPMSARVRADPSADVRVQPRSCDHPDCTCLFICVNGAMFWLDLFYWRKHWFTTTLQTGGFLISSNNNSNKRISPTQLWMCSPSRLQNLFFPPVVSAWMTRI